MDRHLNVFLPYERPPHHEDQLTRAAMIVMRALPLARDALLARIGALPSARLPEPELDMQTRHVLKPPALGEADGLSLHQLISVFLSPDEGLDLPPAEIADGVRGQRLDGVLRFGDELVVVIESKVVSEAPSDQARLLRLRGVEVQDPKVIGLGWHELLEDWWGLLERGLLAPAERVLMEDLIAFAEEHFARLLPFTTLGRARDQRPGVIGPALGSAAILRANVAMPAVTRGDGRLPGTPDAGRAVTVPSRGVGAGAWNQRNFAA